MTDGTGKRGSVAKEVGLFTGTLVLEAARDLVLAPAAIGAALIDFAVPGDDHGRRFRSVVRFRNRTSDWIDRFKTPEGRDENLGEINALVSRLERIVRDPNERQELRDQASTLLERYRKKP